MCIRDRYEGGQKILKIFAPDNLTEQDLIKLSGRVAYDLSAVSYTHLRAHETVLDLVCRLLLEKKNRYEYSPYGFT